MRKRLALLLFFFLPLLGCEDINLRLATEAGQEAIQAATLSDEQVQQLSRKAAERADQQHRIAPPGSEYHKRLQSLVEGHRREGEYSFSYAVYLSSKVNAFALGDGTIRIYSGLMDMMTDEELLFVIGHEMGHVLEEHVREKMAVALAGSALRKGIAAQGNIVGDLARSVLGDFVQRLVTAQFSQQEEKEADDYAFAFMQREGYQASRAVTALEKLSELGGGHSFLSSHPAPEARAERLRKRLQGEEGPAEEEGLLDRLLSMLRTGISWLGELLGKLADWLAGTEASPGA